ncbi:MAG: hypothetical protein R3288_03470 [Woeseiaceae bacterium]|nr:hypothetical protein [Woeseiaceae bacterium]
MSVTAADRIKYGFLAVSFAVICWVIGVLAGSVVAYFVWFFAPASSGKDWPALIAFVVVVIVCGAFGLMKGWQMYRHKMDEIAAQ